MATRALGVFGAEDIYFVNGDGRDRANLTAENRPSTFGWRVDPPLPRRRDASSRC